MLTKNKSTTQSFICSCLVVLFSSFAFMGTGSATSDITPLRGQAQGTAHIQGHSGPDSLASLSFYNVGKQSPDKAYGIAILKIKDSKNWPAYEIQGTFSGGPRGVLSLPMEYYTAQIPLIEGKVFSIAEPGLWIDLTISNPAIFEGFDSEAEVITEEESEEEAEAEEEVPAEETARDSRARVSDLNGQVEIACPPNLEAWDVMKMGRVIYVDCHLRTGEDSTAEISFGDMTTFKMRPESEIVIDTPPEKDSKISLIMGNVWVNVKQMIKDGTMTVHQSQAVAGIKGTIFVLEEDGKNSKLKVIEGVVAYTSNTGSESRNISAGQAVTATKAGLSETKNFDLETENKLWRNTPKPSEATSTKLIIGGLVSIFTVIAGLGLVLRKKPNI